MLHNAIPLNCARPSVKEAVLRTRAEREGGETRCYLKHRGRQVQQPSHAAGGPMLVAPA